MKINPPFLKYAATQKLFESIPLGGERLRFVGGCVRDAILGIDNHDLDLATSILPHNLMSCLSQSNIKVIPTGIDYGTITVVIDQIIFQITSLRSDIQTDGRHAVVKFTDDWHTDAMRRDFTMNALFLDIEGTVHDYTNGIDDLLNKQLKFIGDPLARIQEDYLRILRYFRFRARFGQNTIDHPILEVIKQNIPGILRLSGERIASELKGILNHPTPDESLSLMIKTDVLTTIMGIHHLSQLWDGLRDHESKFLTQHQPWHRRLVALMNAEDEKVKKLILHLKLSNHDSNYLKSLSKLLHQEKFASFAGIYHAGLSLYQDYLLLSPFPDIENLWEDALTFSKHRFIFPLQGEDLMKHGLKPGPELGAIIKKIQTWWLKHNGKPSKEACLKYYENEIA